jgi:hypothetical protein
MRPMPGCALAMWGHRGTPVPRYGPKRELAVSTTRGCGSSASGSAVVISAQGGEMQGEPVAHVVPTRTPDRRRAPDAVLCSRPTGAARHGPRCGAGDLCPRLARSAYSEGARDQAVMARQGRSHRCLTSAGLPGRPESRRRLVERTEPRRREEHLGRSPSGTSVRSPRRWIGWRHVVQEAG